MRTEPRKIGAGMSADAVMKRVKKIVDARNEFLADVENVHVKVQPGNSKTGAACWTVSLAPIVDCQNCSMCRNQCYDIRSDMVYPTVVRDRAKNSAIHKADPARYWSEIDLQVKLNGITQLRLNVGGDLYGDDFDYLRELALANPKTDILFFTKNYRSLAENIEKRGDLPSNIHPVLSAWPGAKIHNPYNLPESHVLFADGKTTAPEFGAYYCGGNCSVCHMDGEGCWNLKRGEHVIFMAH